MKNKVQSTNRPKADPLPHAEWDQLVALFNAGRFPELEEKTLSRLKRYPDSGFAWKALGAALQVQGKDAITALQKAAALLPNDAEAHYNLGKALRELGQPEKAVISYRRAIEIKPDYFMAHSNLGNALRDLDRLEDAAASYHRAIEIKPDYMEAHNNLALALHELGKLEEAVESIHRTLSLNPAYAEAYNNLGNILKDKGDLQQAVTNYRCALELKPNYAEAHNNLGNALLELGRPDKAIESLNQALLFNPNFVAAHTNLGNAYAALGQLDEAITNYRRVLEVRPDWTELHSNLLFFLNYHPDQSAEEIYKAYQEYDSKLCMLHRSAWRAHDNDRNPQRRLRIGYVSPDFLLHATHYFLEPLLAQHDKTQVEVYAYAELFQEDAMTARYQSYADHWIPTKGMSDEALAERIRADGIDILVELAGHTTGNRLLTFARKPAPVSVSWLGYGYTTGLSAIDYYLTDEACVPAGSEALFAETPWRVANPVYAYRPRNGMGEVSSLPAQECGYVTFGTLTRSARVNHRTIRVWSAILNAVPNARLVMDSVSFKESVMQEHMAARFAEHGISRERLEIGFHSPPWDVLRGIDIGLDCFPHNSGTTLFETLYMGVPYITLAGRPSVGRLGGCILQGVGHPEWIAQSEEEYIAKAIALAGDLTRLSEIRSGLRGQMQASPLMDEAGFSRKVEDAYRKMWRIWCEKGN